MKNKKLLLLGTFALVFASGLAAAGSTFAWYTTNRNASLAFNEAEIENLDSDLELKFLGSHNASIETAAASQVGPDYVFSGINRITDVSGDGLNLFKPYWTSKANEAREIIPLTPEAVALDVDLGYTEDYADGFYLDFFFEVSRKHEDGLTAGVPGDEEIPYGMKVYLGDDSGITPLNPGDSKDVDAAKAARLAVIKYENADRDNGEVQWVHSPEAEADAQHLVYNYSKVDQDLFKARDAAIAEVSRIQAEIAALDDSDSDYAADLAALNAELGIAEGNLADAKAALVAADYDEDEPTPTYTYFDGFGLENTNLYSEPFVTHSNWDEADAGESHLVADLSIVDGGDITEKDDHITTAYIAFRVWIEGEDKETERSKSLGGKIKIDLKLYAIHDDFENLPDSDF